MNILGTRNRKVRKQRSSRIHGWGRKGQHRDGGMKGGRGNSGRFKHKWTYVLRYSLPIGKNGFNPITKIKRSIINISELNEIVRRLIADGNVKEKNGKISLDLTELGYDKLLGEGKISRPIEIKAVNCSNSAQKKVERAGGSVIILDK